MPGVCLATADDGCGRGLEPSAVSQIRSAWGTYKLSGWHCPLGHSYVTAMTPHAPPMTLRWGLSALR